MDNNLTESCRNESLKDAAKDYIVWMDSELTGLNIDTDLILEIACLITDKELNVISEEFHAVINQSDECLKNMNQWCTEHHKKSGLIQQCQSSTITTKNAEVMLLNFIKKYIPKNTCPLAGNSVYVDRYFLQKHMPLVNDYLHYRIIDVSSIKELTRRWKPTEYKDVPKKLRKHTALSDVKESLSELKYYKEHIFLSN